MNSKVLVGVLSFALGAAAGAAGVWRYFKAKYERIAQEEIDSVKEVFTYRKPAEAAEKAAMAKEKPDISEYAGLARKHGYINYSGYSAETEGGKPEPMEKGKPYIITPEEFGEADEYETISLTYYADGILTDDADCVISDAGAVVGADAPGHFGEYEEDSVFVRNDRLKTDYEILRDQRKYSDVVKKKPRGGGADD